MSAGAARWKRVSIAALGLALAAAIPSCGSDSDSRKPARAPLLSEVDVLAAYRSPATWRYHPPEEAALLARHELKRGQTLFAGEKGERWLVKKGKPARAAARLAPEALIAIFESTGGDWVFVGKSGTTYEAEKPLGPFVRSSSPLDRLSSINVSGAAILGVRDDGRLARSDDVGATWAAVGPKSVRFVDLAIDGKRGLALGLPEQLWLTEDSGATWKDLGGEPLGAIELERDAASGIVVRGVFGRKALSSGGKLQTLARKIKSPSFALGADPPRGPDAAALREGRAVIVGNTYYETVKTGTVSDGWELIVGAVDGRLRIRGLDVPKACRRLRLSGFGSDLYLACSELGRGSTQSIRFFASLDAGKSWEEEPYSAEGRWSDLRMAVGQGGALVVTGLCPARAARPGCRPEGVYFRGEDETDAGDAELALLPAATPALKGAASAVAFSLDGKVAYAVGTRTKNGALAVFVSTDAGVEFVAREIEQLAGEPTRPREPWRRPLVTATAVADLRPAEDGTVAIVAVRSGRMTIITADDEGRVISVAEPPAPGAEVAMVGTRGFAYVNHTREAWESLDGGASWEPIGGLPLSPCGGGSRRRSCSSGLYCFTGGCIVGDVLSRLGWRGQADVDQGVLAPATTAGAARFDRKIRTPLVCEVGEDDWKSLSGLHTAPDADQVAIGDVDWFAVTGDNDAASVTALHGRAGKNLEIDRVALFEAARKPETMAFAYRLQVEGSSAIRYAIGPGPQGLTNIEIAWDNRFERKTYRARIADAGRYRPGDYERISGAKAQRARPHLLSVASHGIYVRPHNLPRDRQTTYFLDGKKEETLGEVTWPAPRGLKGSRRSEMAHVGGKHVPLMLLGGAVAVRADAGGSFSAFSAGPWRPNRHGLSAYNDIAYVKGTAGLHLLLQDTSGRNAESWVFPFSAKGPVLGAPVAVPTLLSVGEEPKACRKANRNDSPRIVLPYQPGTRHPIIVTSPAEPPRVLLTDQAVMYGTPARPCVAAFDAHAVKTELWEVSEQERAVVLLENLDKAWLFRKRPLTRSTGVGVMPAPRLHRGTVAGPLEYRSMKCRFDTRAEVPFEVYKQPGTRVQRR